MCRASGRRSLARDGAAEGGADTGGSAKQAQAERDGDFGNPRAAGAAGPAGQPAFAPAHRRQQPQRARLVRQPASQSVVLPSAAGAPACMEICYQLQALLSIGYKQRHYGDIIAACHRRSGHYYSHPANHMWRLLIRTGIALPSVQGPAVAPFEFVW